MKNNYTGERENNFLGTDDKDRTRDMSFNVDKLAETLVDQIQTKNKRFLESRQAGTGGSSSKEVNVSYQAATKINASDLKRRSPNGRNSPDSRGKYQSISSKANNENEDYNGEAHKPVVRNNHRQQKSSNQHIDANGYEKGHNNTQHLREKLRGMLQNKRMTNNYMDANTSYSKADQSFHQSNLDNSIRSNKKPRDLSITNDLFNDSMRSELKSIGNPNSTHPYILDELISNATQKRPTSSIYSTPKEDLGNTDCFNVIADLNVNE